MIKEFEEELIKKLGRDGYERVRRAHIGIAGAGGLGSNCAAALVRCGFRRFTIADFDRVEAPNLDRQFYFADQIGMPKVEALKANLHRIEPGLELKTVFAKVEKDNVAELFTGCDVIAECLDAAESKSMFVAECLKLGKFVVTASGLGGIGSSDDIKVNRIKDGLVLIGDLESDICRRPALAPRVNIAASKQADIILEFILKKA